MPIVLTKEEIELKYCNEWVKYVGPYLGARVKTNFRCLRCGTIYQTIPDAVRRKVSTSCKCTWKKCGKFNRDWEGCEEISMACFRAIRRNATDRNLQFDLTIEYIWDLYVKQNRKCAISGIEIGFARKDTDRLTGKQTASLDRIDGKLGYLIGNVHWTHKHINIMRNKFDINYFVEMCKKVAVFN
jgi:hypothetical protein